MSKYNSRKTTVDGFTFDSKKEAKRYLELKQMEKDGLIHNLQLQVPFELIPPFEIEIDGKKRKRRKRRGSQHLQMQLLTMWLISWRRKARKKKRNLPVLSH